MIVSKPFAERRRRIPRPDSTITRGAATARQRRAHSCAGPHIPGPLSQKIRCSSNIGFCRTTPDTHGTNFIMPLLCFMNCLTVINDLVKPIDKMGGFARVD
jgi:hypothetical protein